MPHPPFLDHTGKKFNSLEAIEYTGKTTPDHKRIWLFHCDCGEDKEIMAYSVTSGNTKTCGCAQGKYTGTKSLAHEVWRMGYADGDLDFEEFYVLAQQNCFYCGDRPANKKVHRNPAFCEPFVYSGLDRIDNNRKHDRDNVRSCCWECNEWKADFTEAEFFDRNERIYLREQVQKKKMNEPKYMVFTEKMPENFFCPIWE